MAAVLDTATEEQRAAMVATVRQLAEGYVTPGGVDLPGRALVANRQGLTTSLNWSSPRPAK